MIYIKNDVFMKLGGRGRKLLNPFFCCFFFSDTMRAFIKNNNLLLSLIGSAYDGVSVNDVIFSGRRAVAELLGGGV